MYRKLVTVVATIGLLVGTTATVAQAAEQDPIQMRFTTPGNNQAANIRYSTDHTNDVGWDSGDRSGYRCGWVILTEGDGSGDGTGGSQAPAQGDTTPADSGDTYHDQGDGNSTYDDDGAPVGAAFFRQVADDRAELPDDTIEPHDGDNDPDHAAYWAVLFDQGLDDGARDIDGSDSDPYGPTETPGAQYHSATLCYDDFGASPDIDFPDVGGPSDDGTASYDVPDFSDGTYPAWDEELANGLTPEEMWEQDHVAFVEYENETDDWEVDRDYANTSEVTFDEDMANPNGTTAIVTDVYTGDHDTVQVVIYRDMTDDPLYSYIQAAQDPDPPAVVPIGVVYYYPLDDEVEMYSNFDIEPPATTALCNAAGCSGYKPSGVTVTLPATDDFYGVEATYYTTDGSTPTVNSTLYTGGFNITSDTTVKYFSIDEAAPQNVETYHSQLVDIDSTAPTSSITCNGSACSGTYSSPVTVALSGSDTESGLDKIYYTRDGSTPTTSSTQYTGSFSVSTTETVKWFATDVIGNAQSVQSQTVTVTSCTWTPHSTSATFPGTVTNQGSGYAWTNVGNVSASDDSRATYQYGAGGAADSQEILATNFGFSIPSGATIDSNGGGITVDVERHATGPGTPVIKDLTVQLVKSGGTGVGNNLADTSTTWPGSDTGATYGSSSNLWGTTWSYSDFNSTSFGVIFDANRISGSGPTANVDGIKITVTYRTCD